MTIKFQYYSNNILSTEPLGMVTLETFIDKIRNPKESTRLLLEKIAIAKSLGDQKLVSELKQNLYGFTPCAVVNKKRAYSDIVSFTGLSVLDFDKIDYAQEFKCFMFNTYSSIICCWITPSRKGIKALVKIPVVKTVEEYKSYFYGLASEMQKYNGFDGTTQNAVLLLFIGQDKEILVRDDYTTWDIKGVKASEFDKSDVIPIPNIEPTTKQKEWIVNWYIEKISAINSGAHPQLRDNSVSLGGYVASGYLDYQEAISLANSLISQNTYMQKGIYGYQRTALQAINLGMKKPLIFGKI